jgi:hypothetical protein
MWNVKYPFIPWERGGEGGRGANKTLRVSFERKAREVGSTYDLIDAGVMTGGVMTGLMTGRLGLDWTGLLTTDDLTTDDWITCPGLLDWITCPTKYF